MVHRNFIKLSLLPLNILKFLVVSHQPNQNKIFLSMCHITHTILSLWPLLSRLNDTSSFITFQGQLSPLPPGCTHLKQSLGDYNLSYVGLVFSWEWTFGVGGLSVFGDAMLAGYSQISVVNSRQEEVLNSSHVINFYSVLPALYSTLLTL